MAPGAESCLVLSVLLDIPQFFVCLIYIYYSKSIRDSHRLVALQTDVTSTADRRGPTTCIA